MVKNPPANAGDLRDVGSIPESGRSRGGGHSNPLQYSCLGDSKAREAWQSIVYPWDGEELENPMDRVAWRVTVHGVTKSLV